MTKSARIFCSIAAICYIIYVAFCAGDYWFKLYYSTAVGSILVPLIAVATAVTLLVKNKKAVIVVMGINAIFYGYCVVRDLILRASLDNIIDGVNIAAAYFGLFALIILSLKGNAIVRKIWFVPAAVSLLGVAILAVGYWQHVRTWAGIEAYMQIIGVHLLSDLIIVVAQFFVGMWLKKSTVVKKAALTVVNSTPVKKITAVKKAALTVVNSTSAPAIIGGADKLKMYKELLESGSITQAEFDEKKKQILGL